MYIFRNVLYKNILQIDNLKILENKITCIVGESGSGKTTLLKLLNKLISCDSGEIYFKEQLLKNIDSIELRRKVVMLPQVPAIYSGSLKENLLIGLKFSQKSIVSDEKLNDILKIIKLSKNLDDYADTLSGGEKQRVALGRILLLNPEVLLLDEPSSALDDETENIIINELVEYTKSNNKTLIMVTHSRNIADTFADNIIELSNGRVINRDGESNE